MLGYCTEIERKPEQQKPYLASLGQAYMTCKTLVKADNRRQTHSRALRASTATKVHTDIMHHYGLPRDVPEGRRTYVAPMPRETSNMAHLMVLTCEEYSCGPRSSAPHKLSLTISMNHESLSYRLHLQDDAPRGKAALIIANAIAII